METYYPKVNIHTRPSLYSPTLHHVILTTSLRKKHKKYWYLVKFSKNFEGLKEDLPEFINIFHQEVYNFQYLGIIDPELRFNNMSSEPVYPKDTCQLDEKIRIRQHLIR